MTAAEAMMADRLEIMLEIGEPWPHGILDDFLPADVFAETLAALPAIGDRKQIKTDRLPQSLLALMQGDEVTNTIRRRFGFEGSYPHVEAVYRTAGVQAHPDRGDKPWSGVIYLGGDPKGTELYDADGKLSKVVEFIPNRLVCWSHRPVKEQHAIPVSKGRWVIQWWFLKNRPLQLVK